MKGVIVASIFVMNGEMNIDEITITIIGGIMIPIILYIISQRIEKRDLILELERQKNINSLMVTTKFWSILDKKEYIFINDVLYSLSLEKNNTDNDDQAPFFLKDKPLVLADIYSWIDSDISWWEIILTVIKLEDSLKIKEQEEAVSLFYKILFQEYYQKYILTSENLMFEEKEAEVVEKIRDLFGNKKILLFDQEYLGLDSEQEWYKHFGDTTIREVRFFFQKVTTKYEYELQRYVNEFSMLCSEILLDEINGEKIRKYTENYMFYRINTLLYYFAVKKDSKIVASRAHAMIDLYNKWGMEYNSNKDLEA